MRYSLAVACVAMAVTAHAQQSSRLVTIRTVRGFFLTAVNGGGVGGPNSGAGSAALHSDSSATQPGPWETLKCIPLGPHDYAFQTPSGRYITAVNGGGMGGPNANPYTFHTDAPIARGAGPWESFALFELGAGACALKTADGHWVTVVNGGGWGEAANRFPIHTDATSIGAWERFTVQ